MSANAAMRRLAGLMLLWAIVPLPFTHIVLLPFVLVTAAAGLVRAVWPERDLSLGRGATNLVAVVIVVVVMATGGFRIGPLRPLGHLLLLLSAVQVLAVADRRSFSRALPGILLVWLVGMSASTHVTIAAFFVLSAIGGWWAGMRIHLLLLADEAGAPAPAGPRLAHAAAGALAAIVLAVPVFVAMPRLASPWVTGYGAHAVTGFASTVDLGGRGVIQESREMALVVDLPAEVSQQPAWTRLRGAVLDPVRSDAWAPRRVDFDTVYPADERLSLVPGGGSRRTDRLEIEVLRPQRYLFLPEGTVAIQSPLPFTLDGAGSVVLAVPAVEPVRYQVWVASDAVRRLEPPVARESSLAEPDPEVARLAREIVGSRLDPAARAAAVERFLQDGFEYSLNRGGGGRDDPVKWFLLEGQSGHCEYFAAGMVVLMRQLAVPARMVSGYAGGSVAPGERQVIVRDANAHTWVEVWTGATDGWVTYDPTPAAGVPGLQSRAGLDRLLWAWDWIGLAWDRYVLTFGIGEQVGLVSLLSDLVMRVITTVRWWHVVTLLLVPIAVVAGLRRWRVRLTAGRPARGPAARAVERVARRLLRVGTEIPRGATVRWIGRAAVQHWPRLQNTIGKLVKLAERELYAPLPLAAHERVELRRAWSTFAREAER